MRGVVVVALVLLAALALQFSIDYWCLDVRLYCWWQRCEIKTCNGVPTGGREVEPVRRRP